MSIKDKLAGGVIGFGTAPLGNMFRDIPEEQAQATVDAAWEQGVRYYDTAPFYGAGLAEIRLGDALARRKRDDYVLSTKVGRVILDEVEDAGARALGEKSGLFAAGRPNKMIDDYSVEVMITLATVMGGYALATALHISGPVAMAVAGLIVGNPGVSYAMSDTTKDYVLKFWALIDEVLNAVLFLLIGLEAVVLADSIGLLGLGLLTIPLVLAARAVSVGAPLLFWRRLLPLPLAFPVMTWGGLRGGISIALALSLAACQPAPPEPPLPPNASTPAMRPVAVSMKG